MKIICSKEEYTKILRKCFTTEAFDSCRGCLLDGFFAGGCPGLENAVEINIVEDGNGGENNG